MAMKQSKAIIPLAALASAIALLGAAFAVYAFVNGVTFRVLNADLPGFLFGAVAVFMGVRYFISSIKMAEKIKGKTFSWRNFGGTK
jgi:hypothetical protein